MNHLDDNWLDDFGDVKGDEEIRDQGMAGTEKYIAAGGMTSSFKEEKSATRHRPKLFAREDEKQKPENHFNGKRFLYGAGEFMQDLDSPEFLLESVLQRNYVYSLTAKWGHGKTAVGLTMAVHIAAGKTFAGLRTKQSRVLYMAGENPADVQFRLFAICREYEIDIVELNSWLIFSNKAFPVNNKDVRDFVVEEVKKVSEIDLVIIDTGPAHTDIDDENSNTVMQKAAYALRELSDELGDPCVVVMLHPTQGATRENLRSRGGGAFAGQIDGELLLWKHESTKQVEFWHSDKFRGGGFEARWFDLQTIILDEFRDNFDNPAITVVASHSFKRETKDTSLSGSNLIVFDALRKCKKTKVCVSRSEWKRESMKNLNSKSDDAKEKSFNRAVKYLVEDRMMVIDKGGISGYCLPGESDENIEAF